MYQELGENTGELQRELNGNSSGNEQVAYSAVRHEGAHCRVYNKRKTKALETRHREILEVRHW